MGRKHLDYLASALERHGWAIVAVEPGNDLDVSEFWAIERRRSIDPAVPRRGAARLVFEGMGDVVVLPVEESYGCFEFERPAHTVYFSRRGRDWKRPIDRFVSELDRDDESD